MGVAQQRKPDQGRARARERERGIRVGESSSTSASARPLFSSRSLRLARPVRTTSPRPPKRGRTRRTRSPCSSRRRSSSVTPASTPKSAKANKERLRVLLEEARDNKGDNSRYKAALNGESMGTHSTGTTLNAKAVE